MLLMVLGFVSKLIVTCGGGLTSCGGGLTSCGGTLMSCVVVFKLCVWWCWWYTVMFVPLSHLVVVLSEMLLTMSYLVSYFDFLW